MFISLFGVGKCFTSNESWIVIVYHVTTNILDLATSFCNNPIVSCLIFFVAEPGMYAMTYDNLFIAGHT